jgi:Resolvase, N terminal domain
LETAHVDLFLHQQAIDTTTPAGRMFFHVTGAFAEFERGMIRQRVNAGLERARAKGVLLGRDGQEGSGCQGRAGVRHQYWQDRGAGWRRQRHRAADQAGDAGAGGVTATFELSR